MEPPAVAADDSGGAPHVPEHRDEHVDAHPGALDVAVERPPEPPRLVPLLGHEWVDQHDRVVGLDVDGADLVAPFAVVRAPPPEPVGNPRDLHRGERTRAAW